MTSSEAITVLRDAIRDTALETDMKKRWDIADHALAATESVQDEWIDTVNDVPPEDEVVLAMDVDGDYDLVSGACIADQRHQFIRWQPLPLPPATNQEKP
jgi:hypothetical protein